VRLYIAGAADAVLDGRDTAAGMVSGRESEFVDTAPRD
jgi:small subunit ribosomal protein S2